MEIRSPGAPPLVMAYDDRGRIATMTQAGRQMTIEWDASDRAIGYRDALGRKLTFTRDPAGRIIGQALPGDRTIAFQYDAQGNVLAIQPPNGAAHSFAYGPTGELTRDESPGSQVTRYAYNKDLTHVIRPDQTSIDFAYDSAGRVSSVAAPDAVYSYTYDSAGTLRTIDAPGSHVSKTMDGFLPVAISWSGTVSSSMGFAWDANFRLGSDVAEGISISYAYDPDGPLVRAGALSLMRDAGLASGSMNLYAYAFNDPVNSVDPNGRLSIPLAGWVDLGETAGSAALNQWADHITDPNATGIDLVGSYIGGFFAALWTPCTSDRTFLTLSAAYAVNTYVGRPFYQYYPANNAAYESRYLTRGPGWKPPCDLGTDAAENLALPPHNPATAVRQVPSRWNEFVGGPRRVAPAFGQPGGGTEYLVGGWPR